MSAPELSELAKLIRSYILRATTVAGSGHPTSSLSAVELMTALFFGGVLKYRLTNPEFANNDRVIFSKGHAAPLFYALWAAAGAIEAAELSTLRQFGSRLEGHPTRAFPFTEVPTGSLGQGLSVGVGMAMNVKYLGKVQARTYVLLGDSEMAEGSNWEAIQLAAHYKLGNLIGIVDVNKFGQRGETMYGHDTEAIARRVAAFGWETVVVDGHNFSEIFAGYYRALASHKKPTMIVAKTLKGKGFSLWENQENWHSKTLSEAQFELAMQELGPVKKELRGQIAEPEGVSVSKEVFAVGDAPVMFKKTELVATKKAVGMGLVKMFTEHKNLVVLDAEVSNSTHTDLFKAAVPTRFFEMFIAEQNMVGVAVGMARRGRLPVVSTFAAFFARAFDQIRMAQYANVQIIFHGAYAGVSLGMDGASQMGLEDIAFFRTLLNGIVLYPSDATSAQKMLHIAAQHRGLSYIRTTREPTPILYDKTEEFHLGGSKILRQTDHDVATIIGAGITLHEALKAWQTLHDQGKEVRVIDLYSIKPLDTQTLRQAALDTGHLIIVEDHFRAGGIGEAVRSALAEMQLTNVKTTSLCVRKLPCSGKPDELLEFEEISATHIVNTVIE